MAKAEHTDAIALLKGAHERGARNGSIQEKAAEYRDTGTDHSKQRIEGYLDI